MKASCAIITDWTWFLLQVKDQQHPYGGEGLWSLFGGGVEDGETSESALRRELKEELGTDLSAYGVTPLSSVEARDTKGFSWTWTPFSVFVADLPQRDFLGSCSEGHPILIRREALLRALEMEVSEGGVGRNRPLFFPGIYYILHNFLVR